MEARRSGTQGVVGYTINEFVPYSPALGRELLVGLRWTDDVGPVVTRRRRRHLHRVPGAGVPPGQDVALFSPALADAGLIEAALQQVAVVQLATRTDARTGRRCCRSAGSPVSPPRSSSSGARSATASREFEVNPFVIANDGRVVALDVLLKLRREPAGAPAPQARPIAKLARLLEPRSVAIMGVSETHEPRAHHRQQPAARGVPARADPHRQGRHARRSKGAAACPTSRRIPDRVDLFVLCVDAAQASAALVEIIEREKAESVVLIPGGLEEKAGSEAIVARMRAALAQSRAQRVGRPRHQRRQLPRHPVGARPLRHDVHSRVQAPGAEGRAVPPRHRLPERRVRGVEGQQARHGQPELLGHAGQPDGPDRRRLPHVPEGRRRDRSCSPSTSRASGRSTGCGSSRRRARSRSQGRTVILYRAGRTPAGAQASASHTASIAGDYAVMRALCASAGVVVAESLDDFEDLVVLFSALRPADGAGLAARRPCPTPGSSAWRSPTASGASRCRRSATMPSGRSRRSSCAAGSTRSSTSTIPIDLTPMTGDEAYADTVRALLDDDRFDAVVVGIVPLTAALNTLPPGAGHRRGPRAAPTASWRGWPR
ncbi:MAG: hypothetical protein M0C28_16470 [Candidatus Moduliflexus flocculans]|nr:hypothetical protein [Candidatus Moduliflexus flocculans]